MAEYYLEKKLTANIKKDMKSFYACHPAQVALSGECLRGMASCG